MLKCTINGSVENDFIDSSLVKYIAATMLAKSSGETRDMTRTGTRFSVAATALFFMSVACFAQNVTDPLKKGFENPPSSARPRVWWHWMNGNITQEGIKLDLEWMHRVGIAGYQNFDAALQTPQVVDKRLAYMTPEWKQAFKYAITLGNQFGMEMAIAGSPGWSESGGPWVTPSQGMKKYVWSETRWTADNRSRASSSRPQARPVPFKTLAYASSSGHPQPTLHSFTRMLQSWLTACLQFTPEKVRRNRKSLPAARV